MLKHPAASAGAVKGQPEAAAHHLVPHCRGRKRQCFAALAHHEAAPVHLGALKHASGRLRTPGEHASPLSPIRLGPLHVRCESA